MKIEKLCNEVLDELNSNWNIEQSLRKSFITIIMYLNQYPENISVRSKNTHDVKTKDGIRNLATMYLKSFYSPTIPKIPQTIPDEMVSLIMEIVFEHSKEETNQIKKTHLESMASENAVGTLLERYLDSVLREQGWAWCCGNFVKAIDFIKYENGTWFELQIKNRSNTENSSSSKIRIGTSIHKWYRTEAKTGDTMWASVPEPMKGLNLSEEGFKRFVYKYLMDNHKNKKG